MGALQFRLQTTIVTPAPRAAPDRRSREGLGRFVLLAVRVPLCSYVPFSSGVLESTYSFYGTSHVFGREFSVIRSTF
jgi:hypothetical protein